MAGNPLVIWLASLDADRLADILRARLDVHRPKPPRSLPELAARLADHGATAELFGLLPAPALQVLEALQLLAEQAQGPEETAATLSAALGALGRHAGHSGHGELGRRPGHAPPVPRAALAALLGCEPGDPELARTLDVLADYALVWPDGTGLRVTEGLRYAFGRPLGLDSPLWTLLAFRPADELRAIATRLGRPRLRLRAEVLADLVDWLGRPENARAVAARAPGRVRGVLNALARDEPGDDGDSAALRWGAQHGLLAYDGWAAAEMPREVALALRGPDWHAPFTPHPPVPSLAKVDPAAVRREAAAAASEALNQVGALLTGAATTPVALLKQGGVGVREIRRLARALGGTEAGVRLWLHLAGTGGLLAAEDDGLLPTAYYDEWNAAEPARRLAVLLAAWWHAPDGLGALRVQLFGVLDRLSDGQGAADSASLVPVVAWFSPLALDDFADPATALQQVFEQATRLGLVAHGALTPLGRALLADPDHPALDELRPLLHRPSATARFQADLTAVVAGAPEPALAALLDGCADRESRGAASVWRLSPASVRRALDAGTTGDDLLDRLRAAGSGSLPQPVEYLVRDVARRHGGVRVRAVGCVLHSTDEALLAQLLADRALRALRLVRLAPTVVTGAQPLAQTLTALRAAGYLPVGEDESGGALVERAPVRRAGARPPRRREAGTRPADRAGTGSSAPETRPEPDDLVALATALLAAPVPAPSGRVRTSRPAPGDRVLRLVTGGLDGGLDGDLDADLDGDEDDDEHDGDPAAVIARFAPQLSTGEIRILADAVRDSAPVCIRYVSAAGSASTRVIEPLDLDGHLLAAWCQLRDDERMFSLPRIREVSRA